MIFDDARAVADAVLFEGYALYPYRASAPKNRMRWQFGVLTPRAWTEGGGGDPWWQETQCLLEPTSEAVTVVQGRLRFLQLRRRLAQKDTPSVVPWDEGQVQQVDFVFDLNRALADDGAQTVPFLIQGGRDGDGAGATERWPISGVIRLEILRVPAERPLLRLKARVENVTAWTLPGAPRDEAICAALLGTHLLLAVTGGAFVSLLDPPPWAEGAAAQCHNIRTYPVLAGAGDRRDLVLSSPVILYDHPAVAPESPRDLFDATEIDEILSLRILTLTDQEKLEMRATDARLAALLDSVERLGPEGMARLHGTARELAPVAEESPPPTDGEAEPRPAPIQIDIRGVTVGPGQRVRLRPGARRTDAQDMFLAGMTATIESVMRDVDDRICLAVSLEDDPATEILRWQRRFLYFYPDELEPLT